MTPRGRTRAAGPASLDLETESWGRAAAETLEHLKWCIRVNTVNPPGNELELTR